MSSVPGTPEAKDAVLLAQIPTTVEINPTAAAAVKVAYNSEPAFEPFPGTAMSQASNTPANVIKVRQRYYLCSQGVWFDSALPAGPWQTTVVVRQVIYTIPPNSPVYNVVYVMQQVTPTGSVQASLQQAILVCSSLVPRSARSRPRRTRLPPCPLIYIKIPALKRRPALLYD